MSLTLLMNAPSMIRWAERFQRSRHIFPCFYHSVHVQSKALLWSGSFWSSQKKSNLRQLCRSTPNKGPFNIFCVDLSMYKFVQIVLRSSRKGKFKQNCQRQLNSHFPHFKKICKNHFKVLILFWRQFEYVWIISRNF